MVIEGYHGTSKKCAHSIINEKHYKLSTSENEWLGIGIYFFENDKHQAYMFSKYKDRSRTGQCKEHEDIAVLQTVIKSESFLDLITDQGREKLECARKKINDEYSSKYNCDENKLIDFLVKIQPFDFVKAVYIVPRTGHWAYRFCRAQIQVCVKDDNCILKNTIKEVSCDEYR